MRIFRYLLLNHDTAQPILIKFDGEIDNDRIDIITGV